ncbi:acetyl-coenzyme-A carboxylase [Coemansia sp. RSA 678]|nr:acetyl-coenzyme-A carboxylase [Coemansia sp. RSA 678]
MYMQPNTSEDGVVQLFKQPGTALGAGEVIGMLMLDNTSLVKHAKPFEGQLAACSPPQAHRTKTHQLLQHISELLQYPELLFLKFNKVLSALHSHLSPQLMTVLQAELVKAHVYSFRFPATELLAIVNSFIGKMSPSEAITLMATLQPINQVLGSYKHGLAAHEWQTLTALLQHYYDTETMIIPPLVENIITADPANPTFKEQVLKKAGIVWYPNSVYKTGQAIANFNNGKQQLQIIFANWCGFSGGQCEMCIEVLKYGTYIVNALTKCKQPMFVYIILNGELCGGAWAVVNLTISPEMMEIYADSKSRGSVLKPKGIVEIKFHKLQMLACMECIDLQVHERLLFKNNDAFEDDKVVVAWLEQKTDHAEELFDVWKAKVETENVVQHVNSVLDDALLAALQSLSPKNHEQLLSNLQ